jgi:hypothetical protein
VLSESKSSLLSTQHSALSSPEPHAEQQPERARAEHDPDGVDAKAQAHPRGAGGRIFWRNISG